MDDNDKNKFGPIKGVLIPNITMMFGVILFLRLGVLTAHAGSIQMLFAIGLSLLIMICTSFSIGALATNMRVGSGGVYYIISRTLGVEVGGAIGLAMYFALLISITLTVAGFSVSLCDVFPSLSVSAVEFVTLTVLTLISGFSASWSLRLQGVILVLLLSAVGSVLLGSADNLQPISNPVPFYVGGTLSFWQTFALFYPAMTGIEAGMALSGSLRNPGQSLYRGNLYSLIFVAICYSVLVLFSAWKIPHDVLVSDPFSFVDFALSPELVHAGIWGATLSSALGCLLGAPRMLQSMADDGIVFKQFGYVYGRLKEPRLAAALTYVIAAILLFLTSIDQIIPMLAMICLVSYGLLNFVTACNELMNTPAWRPLLRTHWLISVLGFVLIVIAMFMTAPGWAILTIAVLVSAQLLLQSQKLETGYQDLRESIIFFISRLALYRLGQPTQYALTWHPQVLALITAPDQQVKLVQLANCLTRRSGILSFATVVPEEWQNHQRVQSVRDSLTAYFEKKKIACLPEVYAAPSLFEGYCQLIKAYGIGPIQPNTVLLEIQEDKIDEDLIAVIETCAFVQKNVVLMRNRVPDSMGVFSRRASIRKRHIHVCWDPDETSSFDLTLSLVTTLTDGMVFLNSKLTILAEASDVYAKASIRDYLQTYLDKSRLKASVFVTVEGEKKLSAAQLGFISLKPLAENADEKSRSEYIAYLKDVYRQSLKWESALFVTGYDQVDHRAIYFTNSENSE